MTTRFALLDVIEAADWDSYHRIRRQELFEARGLFGIYDPNHPDDLAAFAHPLLLKVDGRPVGTTRLDVWGDGQAVFRLVAITASEQGKGYGRVLADAVEQRARELGVRILFVNAAPTAVGFYEKMGWEPHEWDPDQLVGLASDCVQMRKRLQ
jgi:GNAT superfamily N-acetyltransferase